MSSLRNRFSSVRIPVDTWLPFVMIIGMFAVARYGLMFTQRWENEWKPKRWRVDEWDRQMMIRDQRLTGKIREQAANAEAPVEFETNSKWNLERTSLA
ncbi:hypothetical protein DFJ74DRAFT_701437 [Hyaloraphidium curvatum]|nr:hypothetical protein DFJ74DRAFT_701437 [Hyaloraphidium curvatum]